MNESTLVPREEMSDLDWLARNVHEWPDGKEECLVVKSKNPYPIWSVCKSSCGWIERGEWLSRRAELQKKPSWAGHPDAKCFVQHLSGQWWKNVETCDVSPGFEGFWKANNIGNALWAYICQGEVLGDWRDTLEKRPEQTIADICREVTGENRHEEIFEPFVSVEDAKLTIMQSDGDVKHFGGIISRSLPLEEDAATAKQHDPVNSPSHYASGGIECIDAIKASMSHEAFLGYLKGNVQKYMWRYEKKVNPSEDLKKARWHLDKLIEGQK